MSAQALTRTTPEQYLEMERSAGFQSEYCEGQVYAMPGGTVPHARTIADTTGALFRALKQTHCAVISSEAELRVSTSTEVNDCGFKFGKYRKLESLRGDVPVSQRHSLVKTFEEPATAPG